MLIKTTMLLCSMLIWSVAGTLAQAPIEADICIYGGTSAGVISAYSAEAGRKRSSLSRVATWAA